MHPDELRYTKSHEWIYAEGDIGTIGITFHAQDEMQEVVYIELPEVGTVLTQGEGFGVVESIKAAFDLHAPVSGSIMAINGNLVERPQWINDSPYKQGWMIKIQMSNRTELSDLMDSVGYQALLGDPDVP